MTILERCASYLRTAALRDVDQALEDFRQYERSLPIKCEKAALIRRKILASKRRLLKLSVILAKHKTTE